MFRRKKENFTRIFHGSLALAGGLLLAWQTTVLAAANLQDVRFHSGADHDRVVFDLTETPLYTVRESADGQQITLDFTEVGLRHFQNQAFQSKRIKAVSYRQQKDHFLVTLSLPAGMTYKVSNLHQPARVFIDILPKVIQQPKPAAQAANPATPVAPREPENTYTQELAPGIWQKTCVYWDDDGKVSAWFIIADHKRYQVKPALGRGKIPGRETVSGISDRYDAVAAVNASYFNWNGDLLGVTKIDGSVVGTTYITRSAFGIMPDGRSVFGTVSYSGLATLGGVTLPVGGVDCDRASDSITLYNKYYGSSTGTNAYGREFVVQHGKVTAIHDGDSAIPADGWVVSAHGKAVDALAGVKVGDAASIAQDLGSPWNEAVQVVGVGPRLLAHGQVKVTAAAEEFPGDIRYGRAPRSAVGVLANGDYILGVVDGRQSSSHGLTLTEWAQLLRRYGAVDALNFDGGGSSELVVGGKILNSPSDGSERPVGAALLVLPR